MTHIHHARRSPPLLALLLTTMLAATPAWANDDEQPAGAQAAGLETQANELEAQTAQACLKVAAPSRALCREQLERAVARLRDRAQRVR